MATAIAADGEPRSGRSRAGPRWMRIALAVLLLLAGGLAVRHGIGLALATRSPDTALRVDRENAIVRAQVALAMVEGQADRSRHDEARALARSALARDAGNVTALAVIGLTSPREQAAAPAFRAAGQLSRRSLLTQLWEIETAVAAGDIVGALRHYDIALRTSRAAPAILFPVLVNAATDPALQPEIAMMLARRPVWGGLFIQQLGQSAADVRGAARLFIRLKRQRIPTGAAADAALYARLVEAGSFDMAWQVYAAGTPAARPGEVQNPRFARQPLSPAPFDWQATDDAFVSARIERDPQGQGRLVFSTASGEGGEAARQMLALRPGAYRIRGRAEPPEDAAAPAPYLRVSCLPAGAELVRLPLAEGGRASAGFAIPASCPAQMLTLVIQPPSGLATLSGALRQVDIVPAR